MCNHLWISSGSKPKDVVFIHQEHVAVGKSVEGIGWKVSWELTIGVGTSRAGIPLDLGVVNRNVQVIVIYTVLNSFKYSWTVLRQVPSCRKDAWKSCIILLHERSQVERHPMIPALPSHTHIRCRLVQIPSVDPYTTCRPSDCSARDVQTYPTTRAILRCR